MNAQPLITVIVPVYNTAPYLRRCLDSVCGQTYTNLEIICVNDGSTDDSASILAEYAARDARVKVISQPNAGLSAARNAALKVAMGEYVTGVDSDDYLSLDAYRHIMQHLNAPVDIVCFGVQVVDEHGEDTPSAYFELQYQGLLNCGDVALKRVNVPFCNKLWRRSYLQELGIRFPVGLLHEDAAFYYAAAPMAKNFLFVPEKAYYYVQRSSSIMHSSYDWQKRCRNYIGVLQFIFRFYQGHGEGERLNPFFMSLLADMYDQTLRMAPFAARVQVRQGFCALCKNLGLDRSEEGASLYPVAELVHGWRRWNPFFSRSSDGWVIKFFYLPVFWKRRKQRHVKYKLLGICFAKKSNVER